MKRAIHILVLLTTFVPDIFAHEMRPAYLELHQSGPESYDALWKVPGMGESLRLGLYVELPPVCTNVTARRTSIINNAFTERWSMTCTGGLSGGTIRIIGLSGTMTDVLVRLERLDGSTEVKRLTPSAPAFVVADAFGAMGVARTYTVLGVGHILGGVDHLLFVLALVLLVNGWRRLFVTITAFTVGHSFTLAAATLGLVHVPGPPVEACIALSIAFVTAEILRNHAGTPALTGRAPWVVALTFGLLHGLGFAGALSAIGLPQHAIPLSLLFFNVGVEVGQVLFIACVLPLIALMRRAALRLTPINQQRSAIVQLLPPYAIGSVAMFWVIQRIAAF